LSVAYGLKTFLGKIIENAQLHDEAEADLSDGDIDALSTRLQRIETGHLDFENTAIKVQTDASAPGM